MNNILSEKEYQQHIMQILEKQNGYVIRPNAKFDSRFAVDREMLFAFLNSTQAKTMDALYKIFGDKTEDPAKLHLSSNDIIAKPLRKITRSTLSVSLAHTSSITENIF